MMTATGIFLCCVVAFQAVTCTLARPSNTRDVLPEDEKTGCDLCAGCLQLVLCSGPQRSVGAVQCSVCNQAALISARLLCCAPALQIV